jgi:hypothetical protein
MALYCPRSPEPVQPGNFTYDKDGLKADGTAFLESLFQNRDYSFGRMHQGLVPVLLQSHELRLSCNSMGSQVLSRILPTESP